MIVVAPQDLRPTHFEYRAWYLQEGKQAGEHCEAWHGHHEVKVREKIEVERWGDVARVAALPEGQLHGDEERRVHQEQAAGQDHHCGRKEQAARVSGPALLPWIRFRRRWASRWAHSCAMYQHFTYLI
jgi:hypothetical protein